MAQPDDESTRLLESAELPEGAYVAVMMMVEGMQQAGATRGEALYWTAVHIAALNKMPDFNGGPDE